MIGAEVHTEVGREMYRLIERLYPICRSITGNGVRQTLRILREYIDLEIHEVPTGTPSFDWTVPKEWNIHDAYVKDATGRKVVDFKASNLHVVSYSVPVHQKLPLRALKEHLYSIPEHPEWIPYRTTYYQETWGFCLAHRDLLALEEGEYEVFIEAELRDGHLSYGELYLPGETAEEVLISAHSCHPSLANDNLSGMALAVFLARWLAQIPRRYSYRFLFAPGTIGAITWLSLNQHQTHKIKHGLIAVCVGDSGMTTYKRSRRGNAEIDRAVVNVLKQLGKDYRVIDFFPYGLDERQFCSPGFNLPVGSLMRTPYGQYPEYHTSADNLDLVRPEHLADSLAVYAAVIDVLEHNKRYFNLNPHCEPQLGRRGLYGLMGGGAWRGGQLDELALLWVLNLSDGEHALLDIWERSGLDFALLKNAVDALMAHNLLVEVSNDAKLAAKVEPIATLEKELL